MRRNQLISVIWPWHEWPPQDGRLVFGDNATDGKSRSMNCDVYGAALSAQIQPNAVKLISRVHNDPKQTAKFFNCQVSYGIFTQCMLFRY